MDNLIPLIESYAMAIEECTNPIDLKVIAKIRKWSQFCPTDGNRPIDMGNRTLAQLKPGWVTVIYHKAKKEHAEWVKMKGIGETLPLPLPEATPPTKTAHGGRKRGYRPDKPYDPDISSGGVRMPEDGPENHPDSIPF